MTVFGPRSGALLLHRRRETRHAAASILVFDPVDIVDQKKGHPRNGAPRLRGGQSGARARGQERRQGLTAGENVHSYPKRV